MSRVVLNSAKQTFLLGKQIGLSAVGGEVIGLTGPLGAGKTVFVQGLAEGLSITDNIVSPTFVIMNLYPGQIPLCHIDLYRLDAPLESIGLDEYLNWQGVTAIEWVDKMVIQEINFSVEIVDAGDNTREMVLSATPQTNHLLKGIIS
jgi:tRNA threonylcarbamoyladenosine biosynthesis protein TsaE